MNGRIHPNRAASLLIAAVMITASACTVTSGPAPRTTASLGSPSPSRKSGPSAALLTLGDLPTGFTPVPGQGSPTPFSICDLHIERYAPRGFRRVGAIVLSRANLGRIEQTVFAASTGRAIRYLEKVKRAARSCSRFSEGRGPGRRTFVVSVAEAGELGTDSLSVILRQEGELPVGTIAVFAAHAGTLVRVVNLGSGGPVELALARSLVLRSLSRL